MSETTINTLKPHISLNVKNVSESVGFYTKLFGIEPKKFIKGNTTIHSIVREQAGEESEKARYGYAKFDVENPPLNFVLNEVPYTDGGTLSHLGIQVASTDDVLKTRERWIESGLLTVDEMKVDCCYALQDKTWARDPDGNEWEVFVVLENTEPNAEACACGDKVSHSELADEDQEKALSTAVCCTPSQKASTIGATDQPCCG
ncbi:MAG: ArsI/CadI family heavy metal resistance metalloenzyme [Pyrinomonadaceae bacterium]